MIEKRTPSGFLAALRERAFAPIDIASLVFFRIAFGVLMAWQVCHYFYHGWVRQFWIEPHFLFKYYGFSWVRPWPGNGLYIHVAILGVLALFIAMGFLYRLSTTLFFIGWTYLFLLDEGLWRNHPYLISLFSFLLIFVPANRAFAVDSWLRPSIRTETIPTSTLWILRFQMGVVYFFAGIAKINPDWFHAEQIRAMLIVSGQPALLAQFLAKPAVYYTFAYSSLAFDLSIVALLLWRRTRIAAFCLAVVFHLINARLFPLEVFPWFSIAATTLFLSPEWPRRVFTLFRKPAPMHRVEKVAPPVQWKQNLILSAVTVYVAIQAPRSTSAFSLPRRYRMVVRRAPVQLAHDDSERLGSGYFLRDRSKYRADCSGRSLGSPAAVASETAWLSPRHDRAIRQIPGGVFSAFRVEASASGSARLGKLKRAQTGVTHRSKCRSRAGKDTARPAPLASRNSRTVARSAAGPARQPLCAEIAWIVNKTGNCRTNPRESEYRG